MLGLLKADEGILGASLMWFWDDGGLDNGSWLLNPEHFTRRQTKILKVPVHQSGCVSVRLLPSVRPLNPRLQQVETANKKPTSLKKWERIELEGAELYAPHH